MSSAEGETPSRVGQTLAGKYKLEKLLGAGGMGAVYRAQNVLIGRTVAIKLLLPQFASNADVVSRFVREARAANVVRHANIVDVLDMGQDDTGAPFIVQELLDGKDLAHHLEDLGGRLSTDALLRLLVPVFEAIGLAHKSGVVHRDLKPENIFLAKVNGAIVPKVLDFGISKMAVPGDSPRMTATGVAMGTPAYMAPEQIQGARDLDARADVWAIGVMLYELIAGALPWRAESAGGLFVEICTADHVPLQSAVPGVNADLARVVERCLRKTPAERYPTAAELVRDLRNVQDSRPLEATQRLATVTAAAPPREVDVAGDRTEPRATPSASRDSAPTIGPAKTPAPTIGPTPASNRGIQPQVDLHPPASRLPIRLASVPPSWRRARSRGALAESRESNPALVNAGIAAIALVGALGIAAVVVNTHEPWPVASWMQRYILDLSANRMLWVTVACFVLGVAHGVGGLRMYPTSTGHFATCAGLLGVAYVAALGFAEAQWPGSASAAPLHAIAPRTLPIAFALVSGGWSAYAIRRAMAAWARPEVSGKLAGIVLTNVALMGIYVSWQLARGVVPAFSFGA